MDLFSKLIDNQIAKKVLKIVGKNIIIRVLDLIILYSDIEENDWSIWWRRYVVCF